MRKTRIILVLAVIIVVGLSTMARGSDGDQILAGHNTTASNPTSLTTTVSGSKSGLVVTDNGTSTGAAIAATNKGPGSGFLGSTGNANAFGIRSINAATTHGTGAAGTFIGNQNNGLVATTNDAGSFGVIGRNTANGYGVFGQSKGIGVAGRSTGSGHSGVYGDNTSGGGYGVAGVAGSSGDGIYGLNSGTGYAGYFENKVFIGGALDCSGCVAAGDISGKVNDSEKLDGIDSTGFLRGPGGAEGQALTEPLFESHDLGPALFGFLRLSYACPANASDSGTLVIHNDSGSDANVFVESGTPNPSYYLMGAGNELVFPASALGDSFHIQAQGDALGVMTIEVATVNRPSSSDCYAQAQALLTG